MMCVHIYYYKLPSVCSTLNKYGHLFAERLQETVINLHKYVCCKLAANSDYIVKYGCSTLAANTNLHIYGCSKLAANNN